MRDDQLKYLDKGFDVITKTPSNDGPYEVSLIACNYFELHRNKKGRKVGNELYTKLKGYLLFNELKKTFDRETLRSMEKNYPLVFEYLKSKDLRFIEYLQYSYKLTGLESYLRSGYLSQRELISSFKSLEERVVKNGVVDD